MAIRNKSKRNHKSNGNRTNANESKSVGNKPTNESQSTEPATNSNSSPSSSENNNDPAWYGRDPYLLRDVASYPYGYPYGVLTKLHIRSVTAGNYEDGNVAIPGIFTLRTKPSLGDNTGPTSPASVAAASLYAYVRHLNSGRKNYDPADLFFYLISIAQMYSFVIWAERLYSFTMTYSDQNRYIPDALMKANGVDPISMRDNLANYRAWLNTFINRISCFAVPNDIAYFNKVTFMYQNVFIENMDGNIKDQMYMFVPDGFYKFDLDEDNVGMLDYVAWQGRDKDLKTWEDIMELGEKLLSGLWLDEDSSLMSGDMFKVYQNNIIRLPSLDEFIAIPLSYDPLVMSAFRNADVVSVIRAYHGFDTTQTIDFAWQNTNGSIYSIPNRSNVKAQPGLVYQGLDGAIISKERSSTAAPQNTTYTPTLGRQLVANSDKVNTQHSAHPEPAEVMESTRYTITWSEKPDGVTGANSDAGWLKTGSYIPVDATLWTLGPWDQSDRSIQPVPYPVGELYKSDWSTLASAGIFMFDNAPILYSYASTGSGTSLVVSNVHPICRVNNFTIINHEGVAKLHDVALLSLFFVPGIAKVN